MFQYINLERKIYLLNIVSIIQMKDIYFANLFEKKKTNKNKY